MTDEPVRENPRTRRVRALILETAVDVLLCRGAHEVTAAQVADAADVARTTVYRHWPDQRSLLLATIEALTTPHHHEPASGPLDEDVRRQLEQLRARLVHRDARSVFGALAGYAATDDAFGDAQRLFVQQLTQPMASALGAARERGELPAHTDCEAEATLLTAPVLHQHLALRSDISDELLDSILQRWLTTVAR